MEKHTKHCNIKNVKVTKSKFEMKKGDKAQIEASVSNKGKITAVGKGTCTIYVNAVDGTEKRITVNVK